jgi:hypothetical protein
VELTAYRSRDFAAGEDGGAGEYQYVAYVLRPGTQAPTCIALGACKPIDDAARYFRGAIKADASEGSIASAGRALYSLVWEPIEKALAGVERVMLSPDGELSLVSFGALRGPDGKHLCERYVINELNSGRDLVATPADPGKGAVLLANADFSASAPAVASGALAALTVRSAVTGDALARIIHDRCARPKREALSGLGLVGGQVEGCAAV